MCRWIRNKAASEQKVQYSVPSEYDHQLDPSQIILLKSTIEFRKLSGSSREWSYSEGTLYCTLHYSTVLHCTSKEAEMKWKSSKLTRKQTEHYATSDVVNCTVFLDWHSNKRAFVQYRITRSSSKH